MGRSDDPLLVHQRASTRVLEPRRLVLAQPQGHQPRPLARPGRPSTHDSLAQVGPRVGGPPTARSPRVPPSGGGPAADRAPAAAALAALGGLGTGAQESTC